jgi:hypothetical protein
LVDGREVVPGEDKDLPTDGGGVKVEEVAADGGGGRWVDQGETVVAAVVGAAGGREGEGTGEEDGVGDWREGGRGRGGIWRGKLGLFAGL